MAVTRAALLSTMLLASAAPGSQAGANEKGAPERPGQPTAAASLEAAALSAKADAAARARRPGEAWELYGQAWALDPTSPTSARGICRLAIAFGQQKTAGEVCQRALMLGQSAEDMRNRVASWVVGPLPPSMVDLVSASFMADGAVRKAPQQPAGYWARADIALRLGDRELLNAALSDLRRVAPDHAETKRMIALAAAPRAPIWVWAGRLAVVLAFLVTAGHALRRNWLRPRLPGTMAAAVLAILFVGLATRPAFAEEPPARPDIDDANPEASLRSLEKNDNPLAFADVLQELADRGLKATARGDYAAAARYWTAVTKAVPDRSYGFARLCESFDALGQREQALVACRNAVTREGTLVGDFTHLSELLLSKDGPLTPTERRQVDVSIGQLAKEPKAALPTDQLRCELAAHEHDVSGLRASSARLTAAAPDELKTIWCQWALAVETRDKKTADDLIERVRATGTHGKVTVQMEETTRGLPEGHPARLARAGRWGVSGALAFLLALSLYAGGKRGLGSLHGAATAGHREETKSS
jgi:tetratricopeptide (TPR) repeat protein